MSGADATFIYTETPRTPFEIGSCLVLDTAGRPDPGDRLDRLRARLLERIHFAPQMRQRVQRVPLDLHHPVWVDDENFAIERHVFGHQVEKPGSWEEVNALVDDLMSTPLERDRPLWELHLIEGLSDGRCVLFVKTHHAAVDGLSGLQVLTALVDLEQNPEPTPPPDEEWKPAPSPGLAGLLVGAGVDLAKNPFAVPKAVGKLAGDLLSPRTSTTEVLGASMAPPSPFNKRLTNQRRLRFFSLDLEEVLAVARQSGVKLNDVALCLVGGGLRTYLERHARPTDPSLVSYLPITQRTGDETTGNHTTVVSARIGTDEADPLARLAAIAEQTSAAKERAGAGNPPLILDVSAVTGPAVGALVERLAVSMRVTEMLRLAGNLVVSNVASIPVPVWSLGAPVVEAYPIGPVSDGVGLNFTLLSYEGQLSFSMLTEPHVVPDPDDLVDDCIRAWVELRDTVLD